MWIDIKGYEGLYEVNSKGEVRTKEGKTSFSEYHGIRHMKQKTLKPRRLQSGYLRVCLRKNGESKNFLIHRIVAEAFVPMVVGRKIINHKDGDKQNNYADNLEWCNHKENLEHVFNTGLNTRENAVKLIDKHTKQEHCFRSMAKASCFLGKYNGFVSNLLKRQKNEYGNFVITLY